MLGRRNKRKRPCLANSTSYDDLKLKYIAKEVGCKAPYHNLDSSIPTCNESNKLSQFNGVDFEQVKAQPPCVEIPQVFFKLLRMWVGGSYGFYPLHIGFPKNMKMITQKKALDIHALIGNIGGYIGLFLGTFKTMIA